MSASPSKEQRLAEQMAANPQDREWAFRKLCKAPAPERFFESLKHEGLFDPENIPKPRKGESSDRYELLGWAALSYLLACANRVSEIGEGAALARSIMQIVREISQPGANDQATDNPTVFWQAAEIVSALPVDVVQDGDDTLARIWLGSRFGPDPAIGGALGKIIERLLNSTNRPTQVVGLRFLDHCLDPRSKNAGDPVPLLDQFWLGEIVKHSARRAGAALGREAAEAFSRRLRDVFLIGPRASASWSFRPAVEENEQNYPWRAIENAVVTGLRDAMLGWTESSPPPTDANDYCRALLTEPTAMIRRVGIFILDQRPGILRELIGDITKPEFFTIEHRHELYALLKNHFDEFSESNKSAILGAIEGIAMPNHDAALRLQQDYLDAIPTDYSKAETLRSALASSGLAAAGPHPEFNAFMQSVTGPGPSPYSPAELVAFACDGSIVHKLNDFKPSSILHGPTAAGLSAKLEEAVTSAPTAFLTVLNELRQTSFAYQACIIRALGKMWKKTPPETSLDWSHAWPALFGYFEAVTAAPACDDSEAQGLIAAIADLLQDGIRDDARAYPAELLSRGWAILGHLAERALPSQRAGAGDPMQRAINTPHGRVIEAIVVHALRVCRLADKSDGNHANAWQRIQAVFDRELAMCTGGGNLEFSTLAGNFAPQLGYLSATWLGENANKLFPEARPENLYCAFSGLGYATFDSKTYQLLEQAGVILLGMTCAPPAPQEERDDDDLTPATLGRRKKSRTASRAIVRWLIQAYLLGCELPQSEAMHLLFGPAMEHELEQAVWLLGTARGANPSNEARQRVAEFALRCAVWANAQGSPAGLLLALGGLIWALPGSSVELRALLVPVARAVATSGRAFTFAAELLEFPDSSSAEVSDALLAFAEEYKATFDYQDQLKTLIRKLARAGRRETAIEVCARLIDVDGMPELAKEIASEGASSP